MKVVINMDYGGFGLSPKALLWLHEQGYNGEGFKIPVKEYWGEDYYNNPRSNYKENLKEWREYQQSPHKKNHFVVVFTPDEQFVLRADISDRSHPLLVQCVETLGLSANGQYSDLKVVEIPDGIEFTIEEYDGREHVAEKHRTWY